MHLPSRRPSRLGPRVLDPAEYRRGVVAALASVFDQVRDPAVATVVATAVDGQLADPSGHFEVILDSPMTANWRLKGQPDQPASFRVADCRLLGTAPRADVDAVNERLAALAQAHLQR